MNRERTTLTPEQWAVKEKTYSCGAEMFQAVMVIIGQTYPFREREELLPNRMPNPHFDRVIGAEYTKAVERARRLLNEQRNIVADKAVPRYIIKARGPGAGKGSAHDELRTWLVDGVLDRLYEKFVQWSPLLVASQYERGLQETLNRIAHGYMDETTGSNINGCKERLALFLDRYSVELPPGKLPLAAAYDGVDVEYAIPPVSHIPQPHNIKGR